MVCSAIGGPTTVLNTGVYTIVEVDEVANVAGSSCVDGYSGGAGSGVAQPAPVSTGSVTTTDPYDFIFVAGGSRGEYTQTITEANSYTGISTSGWVASALNYQSFYGLLAATGSVSDTVTATGSGFTNANAILLALKPSTSSTAIVEGDLLVAGPKGAWQAYHQGAVGTAPVSNGPNTMPTPQAVLTTNPLSGMTAGQVPLAATSSTVTSSRALAGSGTGITTGPTSTTSGDCVKFTNTSGQIADNGSPCGSGGGTSGLTQIAQTVVSGSSTSSVTFSGIAGSYTSLELVIFGQVSDTAGNEVVLCTFNSDTGSNYDWAELRGGYNDPAIGTGIGVTAAHCGTLDGTGVGADLATQAITDIAGYSTTTWYKTLTVRGFYMGGSAIGQNNVISDMGDWRSTSAITSITLTDSGGGHFVAGTTFTLYGVQ